MIRPLTRCHILIVTALLLGLGVTPASAVVITVTNNNNSGAGSLRQAITDANTTVAFDEIRFNLPAGQHTITPTTALPILSTSIDINGTSQPNYAGVPLVDLDGSVALGTGIHATANLCSVRGLAIHGFATGLSMSGNLFSVTSNYIGLNSVGAGGVGNTGGMLVGGDLGTIGGTTAAARNVISGNATNGINLSSGANGNLIYGNYIGTNVAGTAAIANGGYGIRSFAVDNQIGTNTAGGGNLISGNYRGVSLESADPTGTSLRGNSIGLNAAGTGAVPNQYDGVELHSIGNSIGGSFAGDRNVISGNGGNGISINPGATGNLIYSNYIGTNAAGTAAVGNGGYGIRSFGADNDIGSNTAGTGNLISGNYRGISLESDDPAGTSVRGNIVGLNATGTAKIPNTNAAIDVYSSGNAIGGTLAGDRNIVSGNGGTGLTIGETATDNAVVGNFIGTSLNGTFGLGNTGGGIRIDGDLNQIGGTAAGAGNVISGNDSGLSVVGGNGNVIEGNRIGTNATGNGAIPNNGYAIRLIGATGTVIGGPAAGAGNLMSGNARGVAFDDDAPGNILQGNIIGLAADGQAALGNQDSGLDVESGDNLIGGADPGTGNVIASNSGYGIVFGSAASGNIVQGNKIGVAKNGITPRGNSYNILFYGASGNTIGGTGAGEGNIIAAGINAGVYVWFGTHNSIRGNSIFSNGGLGIDLDPQGILGNDALDADTGSNEKQNLPVLTSALLGDGTLAVLGELTSQPSTSYDIDFYSSPTCGSSGFGEGRTFLGSATVLTDDAGIATIDAGLPFASADTAITATATSPDGDTSEFSPCATVNQAANAGALQFSQDQFLGYEEDGFVTILVVRTGGATGAAGVHYETLDDTATAPADYTSTSGTLSFDDGEVVKSFKVPLVFDGPDGGNQQINLALDTPTGGATLGAQATSQVLLFDYSTDFPGVNISDATVLEGDSGTLNAQFLVSLTPTDHVVTFSVASKAGTATNGADYDDQEESFTFNPGDAPKPFTVPIHGDTDIEGTEVFFVQPNGISPGGYAGSIGHGFILDDEGPLQPAECGNTAVQAPETCDDGDVLYLAGDFCAADCVAYACGIPTKLNAVAPKSSDALFVLKAAVAATNCDKRVCDVNNSNSVTSTDALLILKRAVGQNIALECPA